MERNLIRLLFVIAILSSCICVSTAVPRFEEQPRDIQVVEGGLAILRCVVTDLGDGDDVYWRYMNDLKTPVPLTKGRNTTKYAGLHDGLTSRISITGDPRHGEYILRIRNIIASDQRQYFCSIITPDYNVYDSTKAILSVASDTSHACSAEAISPPRIFNIGSLVRLTCATPAGSPSYRLAWSILDGGRRRPLLSCPGSPCIYNQELSVEDVNKTFLCELLDGTSYPDRVECTYTPLQRQVDVVVDPPIFERPPGNRQGFMCLPVQFDPNQLFYQWYQDSELIPNGTDYSLINLMISREDAGSTLSCVVSRTDRSFLGIGQAKIEPFIPSDIFPEIEGSSSPSPDHVTRRTETEMSSSTSKSVIKFTSTVHPTVESLLSIQPLAEISDKDNSSRHLSILVFVSAIAGALVTMLICAIGLVVIVFFRKRQKELITLQQNGAPQGNGNCGQLEMSIIETKSVNTCVGMEMADNTANAERQSMDSDSIDRFYVTLEPDGNEAAGDADNIKKAIKESPTDEKSSAFGPPCTPNEYARPQTKPLEISDKLHQGVVFQKDHERTMSESSATAYAVTDVVSHEGRFIFKGMSGRDEAHMGVCRLPSGGRSATLSKAVNKNQSAPPLPARTLPRTTSLFDDQPPSDDSFSQRRQSDSEAIKDKAKGKSKNGFGNRWPWSVRNKKECPVDFDVAVETPEVIRNECESRRLSLASGDSGEYAEIIAVDKDTDSSYDKRHSVASERLGSIPERPVPASDHPDVEAYASSAALLEIQSKIGKGTTTESGYDRLSRPHQIHEAPLQRSLTMPIYAKVKKSKSLDHDGQERTTRETGQTNTGRKRTKDSEDPKLLRSMSEGTAPSTGKNKSRVIAGYDTVEISDKLDHILVQMRNGFSGETVDLSEGESNGSSMNKGSHFADIV